MLLNRLIFISLLFITALYANVKIDIKQKVIKGERLDFTIEAIGNSIDFPKIDSIAGYDVQEMGSSQSTTIINRSISKRIKKTYSFYPKEDFIFPSLQFTIDSNQFYTKEKKISVQNASKTKSDYFDLSIKTNKTDLYVNESFVLTLTYKYKRVADLLEMNLIPPNFDGFWSKQLNDIKQYEDGKYQVQELNYLLSPLKSGKLQINPIVIQLIMLDNSSQSSLTFLSNVTKVHKIYSNSLLLDVKEIPHNEKLIGNFEIKASIDKNKIKKGEAVSYKLIIKGSGNIDDIDDIKLNIPNTTIYDNKPKIKSTLKNGNYEGVYEKVYSIVPNESIVIPSIEFSYFSKEIKQVVLKQTKSFNIEVDEEKSETKVSRLEKKEDIIEKEVIKVVEKSSLKQKVIFYILGILSSLLILGLYYYVKNINLKKKENEIPLIKKIKKAKSCNELLKILVAFLNIDENLDKEIFLLEKEEQFDVRKKNIIKIVSQLKLKG